MRIQVCLRNLVHLQFHDAAAKDLLGSKQVWTPAKSGSAVLRHLPRVLGMLVMVQLLEWNTNQDLHGSEAVWHDQVEAGLSEELRGDCSSASAASGYSSSGNQSSPGSAGTAAGSHPVKFLAEIQDDADCRTGRITSIISRGPISTAFGEVASAGIKYGGLKAMGGRREEDGHFRCGNPAAFEGDGMD